MDVLVLGGSVFLGRAVVREALAAGHDVTVFNRGRSGAAPAGVTQLLGDRTTADGLDTLRGRQFDLVVDTCGYVAADVARSAEILAPTADFYAFVSSISVFPGWPASRDYRVAGVHDGTPDATRSDVPAGMDAGDAYGWLKSGCERAVVRAFGADRCSLLRAGLIVGPDDVQVARLTWWIDRVARGGEVLAPGSPGDVIPLIDSRDLAQFALARAPGAFETPGPDGRDTRADLFAACLAVTGSDAAVTWVDDAWLAQQVIEAWTELPLWLPPADYPGTFAFHGADAAAAGLTWRPLADTVGDTWAWLRSIGGRPASPVTPGLAPERERELLAAWHAR